MEGSAVRLAPRWLHPTERSDVRVSWHDAEGVVVISLWRDRVCIGTAPLAITEASSLAGFLVDHLGARAADATADAADDEATRELS